MVKGGKVSSKPRFNARIRSHYKGSDSDEDYVISDEEKIVSDDPDSSFLDGNASEESFGSIFEEEDEEDVKWARKNSRSRAKRDVDNFIVHGGGEEEELEEEEVKWARKNSRSRAKKSINNYIVKGEEEEEEEEQEELELELDEEEESMKEVQTAARSKSGNGFSGCKKNGVKPSQKTEKRKRVSDEEMGDEDYIEEEDEEEEEEEEEDDDDDDDDDDDEFTLDEDDFSEVEEESRLKKKKTNMNAGKRRLKKKGPVRRKSKAAKKPLRKKGRKNNALRRKVRCDDDDDDDDGEFMDSNLRVREKKKKKGVKRRRNVVRSDSDFVSSGSSDNDYTISEEEREQVREARQLCGRLETNLKSSSLSDKIQETGIVQRPRKPPGRKGKEKIEHVKAEVVKQVCGICLSEEDKRRVRGTLDCCTHYFCFSCIMEWGKVESRCPLCKQRFKIISKPARSAGTDLKEVVIPVPERDQVYQPTEEELRSYLDPYENVICTECHEGGDDGLMLLCDLCDSPAHTYCVGLGQEVPDGNWYCEGCRAGALESSSSHAQSWLPDHRQSPAGNFGEGVEIDLNLMSSPRSYIAQGFGNPSSPWFPVGGLQAASPGSGAGAPTLSGRRLLHRQIHQLLSANRQSYMASRTERNSTANVSTDFANAQAAHFLNSRTAQRREATAQHTQTNEMERAFLEERLQENPSPLVQYNNPFPLPPSHQIRQVFQVPTTTPVGLPGSSLSGHGQIHNFSSRANIGLDGGVSPNSFIEPDDFRIAKEQLQSMVKSHLINLSRNCDLDQGTTTFKQIASSATNTILAACEREHISNEVFPVPPPSICGHTEPMAGRMTSLMRGCCSSCFESFVVNVVQRIMDSKLPAEWLSLGL